MHNIAQVIISFVTGIADWIYAHIWFVVIALFTVWKRGELYQHLFKQPITGGNGVTQVNELAQYALIVALLFMVYSYDTYNWSDGVFYAVCGAVSVIAGAKHISTGLKGGNDKPE